MDDKTQQAGSIKGAPIKDIMGPGNSAEIKVKQEAKQGGARISKNSKKIVFIIIGGLSVAILVGILAAGGGNKTKESESSGSSADTSIGNSPAPKPPAKFLTTHGNIQAVGSGVPDSSTLSGVAGGASGDKKGALSNQTSATNGQGQNDLSPREKYKQWMEEQHYKNLEGNQLSATAAQASGFGEQASALSSQHLQAQADGNNSLNSLNGRIDAIRAATTAGNGSFSGGIDPSLLARLGASGPGSGAADPQTLNKSFVAENKSGDDGYLHALVEDPVGKHELLAGSIIPAVLLTALDSDLPGFVTAMVRQTIYDSLNHRVIVIPQGAKLVGRYSSDVAYGQVRALIAWNRLIFPNGSMIDLQGMSGTDGQGQSGFEDQVDHHYMKVFGSSILISLLGAGAQLSQPQSGLQNIQPTPQQQAAAAMATGMANTGNQLLEKNLSIQPTIKIRAGYLFNVMVNKSMIMPVWAGETK